VAHPNEHAPPRRTPGVRTRAVERMGCLPFLRGQRARRDNFGVVYPMGNYCNAPVARLSGWVFGIVRLAANAACSLVVNSWPRVKRSNTDPKGWD